MYNEKNICKKKTLPEIMNFQYDLMIRAISRYKKVNLIEDINYLSKDHKGYNFLNPFALKNFSDDLTAMLSKDLNILDNQDVYSYTLIDNKYDFGSINGKFCYHKAKKRFAKILKGIDFIGNATFAMYKNEKINIADGKLRSVHLHFITLKPIPRSRCEKIKKQVLFDGAKGVALKGVKYPLSKATSYVWHAPFMEYNVKPKNKNKYSHSRVTPSLKSMYRLYEEFSHHSLLDFTIAGGKFKSILTNLKMKGDKTCLS